MQLKNSLMLQVFHLQKAAYRRANGGSNAPSLWSAHWRASCTSERSPDACRLDRGRCATIRFQNSPFQRQTRSRTGVLSAWQSLHAVRANSTKRTSRTEDRGAPDIRGLQTDSMAFFAASRVGSLRLVCEMPQENVPDDESELEETGTYLIQMLLGQHMCRQNASSKALAVMQSVFVLQRWRTWNA